MPTAGEFPVCSERIFFTVCHAHSAGALAIAGIVEHQRRNAPPLQQPLHITPVLHPFADAVADQNCGSIFPSLYIDRGELSPATGDHQPLLCEGKPVEHSAHSSAEPVVAQNQPADRGQQNRKGSLSHRFATFKQSSTTLLTRFCRAWTLVVEHGHQIHSPL